MAFGSKIKKAWIRLFKMYIIWFILYTIFSNGDGIYHNFICKGNGHLWYLWSCLYCIPIIYFLLRINLKPLVILVIGIAAFIFFRIYSHYGSVDNPQGITTLFAYIWKNNLFNVFGICSGLCYLSIGVWFAAKGTTSSAKILIILLIVGILLSIPDKNRMIGFGKIPIVYVVCNCIIHYNPTILYFKERTCKVLRDMSIFIYLIHIAIIAFVNEFIPSNQLIGWFMALLLTVLLSFVFILLKKQKYFQWLNILI